MKIKAKIAFIVLPLIITPLILTGLASSFAARNGITQVTTEFLRFKAEELQKYAENQWSLLVENDLAEQEEYIAVSKNAVESFARSLIRSDTELIFAFNRQGEVTMSTRELDLTGEEIAVLTDIITLGSPGWQQFRLNGTDRVAHVVSFDPFGWFFFVSQDEEVFYSTINQIYIQSGFILSGSLLVAVILLLFFTSHLTRPLRNVVAAMKEIMTSNDLSKKVDLLYNDETGELAHTFNLMTGELEKAYDQIKIYSLETAISQKKEQKIRSIFQRYVPKEVIDRYFQAPESMLVGEDRLLAVLFSDIRQFTTISEGMMPSEIVESLNKYFGNMVDVIMDHGGIVDKFIGDALMAFFGAPVRHIDDAYRALQSGFDMLDSVGDFNTWQMDRGGPRFNIGVGINYGVVTVGNIGSEKKMDYTVIGDMVNLASRLEDLTKTYSESILFSESVYRKVIQQVPCRMIDRVAVKGKTGGTGVYTARRELSGTEETAWKLHHTGLLYYYNRNFEEGAKCFSQVSPLLPNDYISGVFEKRCRMYLKKPPPEEWNGVVVLTEK